MQFKSPSYQSCFLLLIETSAFYSDFLLVQHTDFSRIQIYLQSDKEGRTVYQQWIKDVPYQVITGEDLSTINHEKLISFYTKRKPESGHNVPSTGFVSATGYNTQNTDKTKLSNTDNNVNNNSAIRVQKDEKIDSEDKL